MTMMKPSALLAMLFAAMSMTAATPAPAFSGPYAAVPHPTLPALPILKVKKKYKPWKGGRGYQAPVYQVPAYQAPAYRTQGGPPPWAPAHGYRAKYPDIAQGTCKRPLLSNELIGAAVGAAIGGLLGSKVGKGSGKLAATAVGVLAGALVGSSIAKGMDQGDNECIRKALEASNDRKQVAWHNPDTGADYRVQPSKTFQRDGRYCREYTTTAVIGGRTKKTYGTACREPDGSWQLMN